MAPPVTLRSQVPCKDQTKVLLPTRHPQALLEWSHTGMSKYQLNTPERLRMLDLRVFAKQDRARSENQNLECQN